MTGVLGNFLACPPRYGIGAAAVPYQSNLPTYVRITDIDGDGRFSPNPRVSVDSPLSHHYQLTIGDLVVARTGASVGKSYRYRPEDGYLVFAGFLINLRPDQGRLDPRYLSYVLQSKAYWDWITSESMRSGQPGINAQQLSQFPIDLPDFDVQRGAADKLADVDSLVSSLERLIAKKSAIKQGMMQELLTGRTRLPGFVGNWTTLHVASASHLKARIGWQGLTAGEYRTSGHYRLVGGTDFRDGKVNWDTTPYVDKWRFDQDRNIQLRVGDVLITKDGTIGKVAFVNSLPGPTTLNSGVFVVRPKNETYDSAFLFHMLRSRFFDEFVAGLSAGSTINHLYQRDLVTLELKVPPTLDEQRAIAEALTDAETEIEALERRLEATRDIKQGMMQKLLTGRTRLAVDEEVAV